MITINSQQFRVEPTYKVVRRLAGVEHQLQDGSLNYDIIRYKLDVELTFTYLTQSEYDYLESLCCAEGNTTGIINTLTIEERVWDSATVDSKLNRILNKVKLILNDDTPYTPYANNDTIRAVQITAKET